MMIGFASKVRIGRLDQKRWVLIDDLVFNVHNFAAVKVPKGVTTDGTSVPRFARPFVSVWGNQSEAAVLHDHLYQTGEVPRIIADSLFMVALFLSDVSNLLTYTMFFSVRIFGKRAWKRHRTND